MERVRTKDKLFLAVVVPIAAAAVYFHFWRADASRRVAAGAAECASLVSAEDFPAEKRLAERRLAKAKESLAAERRVPAPAAKVKADAAAPLALRERTVLEIFRDAGLRVCGSAAAGAADGRGGGALKATGARPEPECRIYAVDGRYPDVQRALRVFSAREMAVVPQAVGMPGPGHWSLTLWL